MRTKIACSIICSIAIVIGAISVCAAQKTKADPKDIPPPNVELTTAAWDALNSGDYKKAIAKADECLARFGLEAERKEAELESIHASFPPTGKVSEQQKQAIFDQGVINDVGTAHFIKGQAFTKLQDKNAAKEAFRQAAKYTYARTWDPHGWFWSPAQQAKDLLQSLK